MTKIFLVRHGQSEANLSGLFLGQKNLDLTELGHMQAQKTAEYLKGVHIDKIYASDLIRAYHTAEHTANLKGLRVIKETGLREIMAGEWEMLPFDEIGKRFADDWKLWCENIGRARCTGGESIIELGDRVFCTVERISKENDGKTVCLFSHATPIRTFACRVAGESADDIKNRPWPSNASLTEAYYENGKFTLVKYSFDAFMGDIVTSLPDNI